MTIATDCLCQSGVVWFLIDSYDLRILPVFCLLPQAHCTERQNNCSKNELFHIGSLKFKRGLSPFYARRGRVRAYSQAASDSLR